jgi:4-hydroxy-tetrahydrodipicolinate synthase
MPKVAVPRLSKALHKGVLAALATPVADGQPDLDGFRKLIDFVAVRGVDGVVVGGATGEYVNFSLEQRACLIREASQSAHSGFVVAAGIGGQTTHQTLWLAEVAAEAGCHAVLLPMPCFFRYQQEDLMEYAKVVASAVKLPCLFYHLPSFTNALELSNLIRLLESEAGFAGIKDSSGEAGHLVPLARARQRREFDLFVGDDSRALDALEAGWDGVISGIACFLPELLVALVEAHRAGEHAAARHYQDELDRVIDEIVKLPIPWAVRIGLEVRGLSPGACPLPLSPERCRQVERYRDWCAEWIAQRPWIQHGPSR